MPDCPDPKVLESLMAGTLALPERAGILGHVEHCPICRGVLDELTDRTRELSADSDDAEPPEHSGDQSAPATEFAREPGLPFLDPSEQDGSLGRLGPYEILQVLGEGSVGIVLKGYEPRLMRYVAIKVLAPQLRHSVSARRRFAREGRATAALDHENIVTVHAVEDQGPRPYLVMEYVPGLSLQQRLDRTGAVPLPEAVRIASGVAAGLAAAHAAGLIHRDVKPGNILLEADPSESHQPAESPHAPESPHPPAPSPTKGRGGARQDKGGARHPAPPLPPWERGLGGEGGRVKLTDFGLVQEDQGAVSQTDVLAGTPLYMSPEQARGERVDARSDLFSLGSVIYAMCAGRAPFSGRNPLAVLRQISEANPRPIVAVNPDVPGWLGDLVARLHAKDPAARPAAAEVATILEQHRADPSLTARRRWPRRAAALLLFVLAGVLIVDALGLIGVSGRIRRQWVGEVTLSIANDDPDATIRLAGREEELTGVGVEEWTIPPGEYLLLTSRVRGRQEEPIQLRRGERREIRVERQPVRVPAGPFVVISGWSGREQAYARLSEAIDQARSGDTIEVRGNGPFVMPPLRLTRALLIRAGAGFQPVLQHDGKNLKTTFIESNRPLVLEGLQLEASGLSSHREGHFPLVRVGGGALGIAGCRLHVRRDGSCVVFEGQRLEVRRSLLLRGESGHGAINLGKVSGAEILLDGNVFAGGHMGVLIHVPTGPLAGKLKVRHSTLATMDNFALVGDPNLPKKQPATPLLEIEVVDSVLAARSNVFRFVQSTPANGAPISFAAAQALLARLAAFRDRGNFFPRVTSLLGFAVAWKGIPSSRSYPKMVEWWDFWGQPPSADSLQSVIAFQGGNLITRLGKDVGSVPVTDFRLADNSPGRGAAPDGKDFGADIDLLGPGPALERWRQTAEYRVWQRQSKQFLAAKQGHGSNRP